MLPRQTRTGQLDGKLVLLEKDEVSVTNGITSMYGRQHGNFSVVYHVTRRSNCCARDAMVDKRAKTFPRLICQNSAISVRGVARNRH